MKQTKPNNRRFKLVLACVIGILVLSSFFGGRHYSKSFWKREIAQRDSSITDSREKQLLLEKSIEDKEYEAQNLNYLITDLENRNYKLYANLKRKEILLRVRDTGFMVNARRISDSVNRFYTENNNPR